MIAFASLIWPFQRLYIKVPALAQWCLGDPLMYNLKLAAYYSPVVQHIVVVFRDVCTWLALTYHLELFERS